MDYKSLYNSYSEELKKLNADKAVLISRINEACAQLGIDASAPNVSELVEVKKAEIQAELEKQQSELDSLIKQLDELKLNSDEFSD